MSEKTPFETIAQRAILLAKALLSKESREYHDDVTDHPGEGELAQALMVVMPYFAMLHIPEAPDGELGGVMLTAEPVERLAMIMRPCFHDGGTRGMAVSTYKPSGMEWSVAIAMMSAVISSMAEEADAQDSAHAVKH